MNTSYVYVVDKKERLIGVLSLRDLILAKPDANISEIMEEDVVSVFVDEDQEEAARKISDYDFLALPVIDKKMVLWHAMINKTQEKKLETF